VNEDFKHFIDITAVGATVATEFFNLLPHISLLLSVVWLCVRIYEGWLGIKKKRIEIKEMQ
jgi:hypothetical protein